MEKEKKKSVYDVVTDQVIALLEKGVIPWKQPWGKKERPQNLIDKIPYRGINVLVLSAQGFERNLFITPKQLAKVGAKWKEGEKPFPVIFWKWPEKEGHKSEDLPQNGQSAKVRPILRYYSVFNVSQCVGIPEGLIPPFTLNQNNTVRSCAKVVANMPNPPQIRHIDDKAYYMPFLDVVNMPDIKLFDSSESYYSVYFHELVHSTGHSKRLNREEGMKELPTSEENYSQEELVAELGACFLEAHTGITETQINRNASYIQNWLNKLKNDKRFLVFSAAQAQKAADYILSSPLNGTEVPEPEAEPEEEKPKKRPRGVRVTRKAEAEEHPTFARH
jgi:antirestriction protein ArdC